MFPLDFFDFSLWILYMSKQNLQFSQYFPYFFYFSAFSAADTWWQPKHTSKEKEKNKGRKRRRYKQIPVKKTMIYQYLLNQGLVKKKVSQTDQSVTTFFIKKCHLEFNQGPPPQIATFNYQGSHGFDKCMIFIHILCIGFCSWYLMAPQPHIQGRTCTGEPGAKFFPKPRFALETGHLRGALAGGTCGGTLASLKKNNSLI